MATAASINARRIRAISRIEGHAQLLADHFGINRLKLPTQGRQPDLLQAQQLEAVVDWLESLADSSLATVEAVDLNTLTIAELKGYAEIYGVDLGSAKSKADILDILTGGRA